MKPRDLKEILIKSGTDTVITSTVIGHILGKTIVEAYKLIKGKDTQEIHNYMMLYHFEEVSRASLFSVSLQLHKLLSI